MKTIGILLFNLCLIIHLNAQIKIGSERLVNTFTTSDQFSAKISHDSAGNYIVIWTSSQQDTDGNGIYGQKYDSNGNAIGNEFQINTTIVDHQEVPDVVMNNNGDFVVTWASHLQDGSNFGVYFQLFSSSCAKIGGEVLVNTTTSNIQSYPSIAMDNNGNFAISWISFNINTFKDEIMVRLFNSSGVPQTSETVVFPAAQGNAVRADVAMDGLGNFAVAYHDFDTSDRGVYVQLYHSSGTPNGTPIQVNTYDSLNQDFPAIAMTPNGDFVIAWLSWEQDGSSGGVYAQRFNASGIPTGNEIWVNTNHTWSTQTNVDLAIDTSGNFTIVWKSWLSDGDNYGVVAKRYLADGTAISNEFQINTTTLNAQERPCVSMTNGGNFVIVWESANQDASGKGVYIQAYSSSIPTGINSLIEKTPHLSIFPNPVKNHLHLKFKGETNVNITILNSLGELVYRKVISTPHSKHSIDMYPLPSGLYTLQIQNSNFYESHKIIKQ